MIKATNLIQTGIAWIAEIPSDWDLKRIKLLFDFNKNIVGKTSADFDVLSLTTKGVIKRNLESGMGKFPASFDGYQIVKPNSIMLCLFDMDVTPRVVGHVDDEGIISAAYTNIIPKKGINSKYYYYYFLLQDKNNSLLALGTGIRITLNKDFFGTLKIPVPPLSVQNSIVAYLDKKNYEIDKFIRNKERLIELLEEEKKIKLYNAVTKGINEVNFLKSNNVNWLPQIPSNWIVKRLKHTVSKISGGITPSMDNQSFWDGDILWVTSKDMKSDIISESEMKITKKALQQTSVKLIPASSILLVVRSGILQHTLPVCINSLPITINQDLKAITVNKKIFLPEYFRLLLKGIEANILHECRKAVATVESIEMKDFTNFSLPIPSIDEQQEIVEYINQAYQTINLAISKAQKEISSIKEYREALITDLVTGKRCLNCDLE